MSEQFEDLKRLAEMRDRGEVTQTEYEKIKAELIAEMGGGNPSEAPATSSAPSTDAGTQESTPSTPSKARDAGAWLGGKFPSLDKGLPTDGSQLPGFLTKKWFWLIVAILVFAFLANSVGGGSQIQPSSGTTAQHEPVEAYTVCQQFVEDSLKAPSTAEFGGPYSRVTTHNGGGEYTVRTYVDAENGFGAMIRNDFTCVVQHSSGDRYRLISLDFDD